MASIEFAFIAEFAKVELNATITAVGAGFRGIAVDRNQPQFSIFIAGCVNRRQHEDAVDMTVGVDSPDSLFSIEQTIEMSPVDDDSGDFATTVFAIRQQIPVAGEGKYTIRLSVDQDSLNVDLWLKYLEPETSDGDDQPDAKNER